MSAARAEAERIAHDVALPLRDRTDREARWPAEVLRALGDAGLLGLHVPVELGGLGLGLRALVATCEALGRVCPSSALCFGMHCVGTAVLAAKATPLHRERYLRAIARGEHLTTLAVSETGTGSHFYLPRTAASRDGDDVLLHGQKGFVTNGAHADSYVVSTIASDAADDPGRFSCHVVDADRPGLSWGPEWAGLGMRGNSSRTLQLEGARVPASSLLGAEGDQVWYVFEVIAPYFLCAMAGTYVGLAGGILDVAIEHLRGRRHAHSGERLADSPILQHRVAELWIAVNAPRALVHDAARRVDAGESDALVPVLASKAAVADAVTLVANEAMTLCGGVAYQENALLARFLRDARAAHVMSPTTDLLKLWGGRALLGLPLL